MAILFYAAEPAPAEIGGIDEYTKLMLHMDGDQSDSQHLVTSNGNPQFSTAQSKFGGSSMLFDGSGDYLTIPTSTDWDFGSGDFTIVMWVRRANTAQHKRLVVNQSSGVGFSLNIQTDNTVAFGDTGVNGGGLASSSSLTADVWEHLAVVGYSGNITIYINGVDKGNTSYTSLSVSVTALQIGRLDTQTGYDMNGYIDELRISDTARWTSDFSSNLPSEPYTSDANTNLLLHFDGDVSESAHVVTSNGNPQLSAATGKFDGAMYFDGSGDYLSIPDSDDWNFGASDMTIDFWVNFSDITGQKFLFNQRADGTHAHELSLNSGSLKWAAYNGGTVFDFSRSVTLSTGTWYHIAAVRNGNVLRLYLDGQQQGADQAFTGTMPDLGAAFDIGRWSGDGIYLNGYIDELRISKGIARWTSNFTPENGPYTE